MMTSLSGRSQLECVTAARHRHTSLLLATATCHHHSTTTVTTTIVTTTIIMSSNNNIINIDADADALVNAIDAADDEHDAAHDT